MDLTAVAEERKATSSNDEQCCLQVEMASLLTVSLNVLTVSLNVAFYSNTLMPNPVNLLMLTNR